MMRRIAILMVVGVGVGVTAGSHAEEEAPLAQVEALVTMPVKPFVVVKAAGTGEVNTGQGVMISPDGYALTAGHISWDVKREVTFDAFTVIVRTTSTNPPPGFVHNHIATFMDRENAKGLEYHYPARLVRHGASRLVGGHDLLLLKVDNAGPFPYVRFASDAKPTLAPGETLYLCHYPWITKPGDQTFLINPLAMAGVSQTISGVEYLADGYFRWGSSGGAILRNGELVGIQVQAYTTNAKDLGEVPMGLISFVPVYRDMILRHRDMEGR